MHKKLYPNTHFLDFHTHYLDRLDNSNITEIVSLHFDDMKDHHYFTIGFHPWKTLQKISNEEKQIFIEKLNKDQCLAMGEMGLDNLKGPDMSLQMDILRSQLEIAQELDLPVIIHCVKAYDQLLQIKKEFPLIKNWCIHGYARHAILANQLIKQGFYISLMPVTTINDKYIKLLQSIPLDKLFLETDSMPNIQIENIYLQASKILGVSIDGLKQQIHNNANIFFKKWEIG